MKNKILDAAVVAVIVGFAIWLYAGEEASKPGSLIKAHEDVISDCETCHIPWRGVREEMCLQCHSFSDPDALKPWLRFHAAEKHCLKCHVEHRGYGADISRVDHTLFHPDLSCTACHFEAHDGRFGDDCRACHRIDTWKIEGYRHPPAEDRNCHRCHQAPASHQEPIFWEQILKGHEIVTDRADAPVEDCWRCHTTHRWGHLMMDHDL
jgi:hypothetical protein